MEQLLPYFQDELATFRRDALEFATRYPRVAGMLGMSEDGCGDPHVERIIQACAMLSARVARKLDQDYPRFTEALLETTYPHYLRPFPSCSIIQIEPDPVRMQQARTIPRGTQLRSRAAKGTRPQFRTTSDVVLSTLTVSAARYDPMFAVPPLHRVDSRYHAALALRFTSSVPMRELNMDRLSLFIDGDPSLCAALRDTLFLRTGPAFLQIGDADSWHRLPAFPIQPAGCEANDALLPWPAQSHPAYRLLTEYFAFPDKFNFIDIDLAGVVATAPGPMSDFTLHLPVRGLAQDAAVARTLASLGAGNLRTHCAPVINLLSRGAAPVDMHRRVTEYPLVIDVARPADFELYSIDAARLVAGKGPDQRLTELRAFYGPFHGQGAPDAHSGGYWVVHRDEALAECNPGHEVRVAVVEQDMQSSVLKAQTLSVDVTCSNRDIPSTLPYGRADGDLEAAGILDSSPIRFLRKPTHSRRFSSDARGHWRLIAHLALNQRALSDIGLVELRKMLDLYDLPRSPITQRQIAGIVGLSSRTVHEWVRGLQRAALMAGIEIRITVDESAYVASGLHVFAQLLDRFFALYGQINVFTKVLLVSSSTGEEILACQPRSGTTILV